MGQAKRYLPLQRGFDFFYGHGNNGIDYYTHERYGVPSMFRGNQRTRGGPGTYATDVFKREALAFIRANAGEAVVPLPAVQRAARRLVVRAGRKRRGRKEGQRRRAGAGEICRAVSRAGRSPEKLARYYGAVTCMDEAIGDVARRTQERAASSATRSWFSSPTTAAAAMAATRRCAGRRARCGKAACACRSSRAGRRVCRRARVTMNSSPRSNCCRPSPPLPGAKAAGREARRLRHAAGAAGEKPSPRKEMFWQRRADAARVSELEMGGGDEGGGLFDLADDLGEKTDLSRSSRGSWRW